jgi:transcriptional regulator with XRE-family HTH domain
MTTETMHIGKKISRIRELKGMKQETLAAAMGVTQQAISKLEQSEHVEDDRLEEVGKALGISADAIKNFNEETALSIISNTFNDNSVLNGVLYNPTFNPIDKIVELYERMLKLEREKIELMEKMLEKK